MTSGMEVNLLLLHDMILIFLQDLIEEGRRSRLLLSRVSYLKCVSFSNKLSSSSSSWLLDKSKICKQLSSFIDCGSSFRFILHAISYQTYCRPLSIYRCQLLKLVQLKLSRFRLGLKLRLGSRLMLVLEKSSFSMLKLLDRNQSDISPSRGLPERWSQMSWEQFLRALGKDFIWLSLSSRSSMEGRNIPNMFGKSVSLLLLRLRFFILLQIIPKFLGKYQMRLSLSSILTMYLHLTKKYSSIDLILFLLAKMTLTDSGQANSSSSNRLFSIYNCVSLLSQLRQAGSSLSLFLFNSSTLSSFRSPIQLGITYIPLELMLSWTNAFNGFSSSGNTPSLFLVRSTYSNLVIFLKELGSSLRLSWFIQILVRLVSLEISQGIVVHLLFRILREVSLKSLKRDWGSSSITLSRILSCSRFIRLWTSSIYLILLRLSTNFVRFLNLSQMKEMSSMLLSGSSKNLILLRSLRSLLSILAMLVSLMSYPMSEMNSFYFLQMLLTNLGRRYSFLAYNSLILTILTPSSTGSLNMTY